MGIHSNSDFNAKRERQSRSSGLRSRWFIAVLILILPAGHVSAQSRQPVWVVTWGASQQIPEAQNALPADDLRDATVRQIFHLSAGGSELRVHLSNAFGTEALHFT
ncbi:MAG TPA: hypothetical protein VJQ54_23025, partial [Candidatus Sulfotelmatobacter sp.]|nr:hypothetical protein [Candidatus Sulfotelmatobacter sp.]